MSLLRASQLRFLARTPWSTLTVLIGMTLGVASVVAVHQISLRVTDSLQGATPPHLAGLSHLLEPASGTTTSAADYFDLRARWRRGELSGVTALLPIVEGQLELAGRRTMVFAADWVAAGGMRRMSPGLGLARGVVPGSDAIVVDASLGLKVDETALIAGNNFTVVAVVDAGVGPAIFADIGAARRLLGVDAQALSYVGAVKADPLRRLKQAIEALLPGVSAGFDVPVNPWRVSGWQVRRVESELPTLAFARSVIFNLGALGSLALVVAWFLIYQVGVIWHRRRRTLMDRLFAMGVTRRELTLGFVAAFAILGTLATVLGVLVGSVLAQVLSDMSSAGLPAPGNPPGLTIWVILKASVSGIAVSCLGGWMACRREWSRQDGPGLGQKRKRWWLIPAVLCALLAAGIGLPDTGLFGGFAAVLSVSLLAVFCVRPLLEHLRGASARMPGKLLTRIGLREVTWYPRDLSIAIGALSLAVATSMGMGLMVDSFRADFAAMLDQRLAYDLSVDAQGKDLSRPMHWLLTQPDVSSVQAYGRTRERLQGQAIELGFTDFTAAESARYGLRGALSEDQAMISERLAAALHLGIGDPVTVRGRELSIVAVFRGFGDAGYRLLVADSTARRLGVKLAYDRLSINLGGPEVDADLEALGSRLMGRYSADFDNLSLQPRAAMRELALDIFDRTFAITSALTLLALLVAVIGMYNALLALRLNQAASYRLLSALGVGALELRWIALRRSTAVGVLAVLLALPLGIAMAWLLCTVINPRAFGWSLNLKFAAGELLIPLALGILAALLAGMLPLPNEGANEGATSGSGEL